MNRFNDKTPAGAGHVLFVNPPSDCLLYRGIVCTWISKAKYVWQPFDFVLLSAFVPQQMKVSYIDSFIHQATIKDIIEFVRKNRVTHVVMSMSSIEWANDKTAVMALREAAPDVQIAVFGDIFQELFFIRQILAMGITIIRHPMDIKIAQYFKLGSVQTPSLLQSLKDNEEPAPVNLPRSIDFPLPRYEAFLDTQHRSPFDKYLHSAVVAASWGCVRPCSYCSWSSPNLPFVYKTAASVLCELKRLKELKVREVFFADLNFGYPLNVSKEIVSGMLKENLRFSWHCYIKPGSLPQDFLSLMRKAGCHTVIIGVESSDLNLSRFNRSVTLSDINNIISLCHNLGIDVCGDFILGLNGSSANWRELARFAITLGLDFASFNVYTPLFGSLERRRMIKEGIIAQGDWGYDTTGARKSLIIHSGNRAKCVRAFYGRPVYWLKRILKLKTLEELLIKLREAAHLFLPKL